MRCTWHSNARVRQTTVVIQRLVAAEMLHTWQERVSMVHLP